MSEPLRIGIIGCARILNAHLRGMKVLREKGLDHFRVTALCSRQVDDAMMFRKRGEGPAPRPPVSRNPHDGLGAPHMYVSDFQDDVLPSCHSELYQILRDKLIDAALILTPHDLHHVQAQMCFEAGVHVLIEKPLAITMAAGRQMVEAAQAAQRTLGVAEVVRYMTETRATRWAIENGILGQIQMYAQGLVGGHEWAPDVIVARTPWRLKKLHAGGGPALDLGVHWFDLIRYSCGEVESVSGLTRQVEAQRFLRDDAGRVIEMSHVDVEDTFFANFTLANGAVGNLMYSWGGHGTGAGVEGGPVIWGTKGCLKGRRLVFDDGMKAEIVPYYQQHAAPEVKEKWFPHGILDPFALQFLDFLSAIERGENPEVSGEEGLKDMAAAYAIIESATAGHLVRVEDVLSGKISNYQKEIDRHHHLGRKKKGA